MKQARSVYENFFENAYPSLPLPKIWQVIYHEGIRGHHIMFSSADLSAIQEYFGSKDFRLSESDSELIADLSARLFSSNDLQEMRQLLRGVSLPHKVVLFILYRRALTIWGTYLKKSLH